MQALWRDDEAAFAGEHVRFPPSWSWPKPAQRDAAGRPRVPVLVGGGAGPKLFAHAVEYADGWMPDRRRRAVATPARACARRWPRRAATPTHFEVVPFAAGPRPRQARPLRRPRRHRDRVRPAVGARATRCCRCSTASPRWWPSARTALRRPDAGAAADRRPTVDAVLHLAPAGSPWCWAWSPSAPPCRGRSASAPTSGRARAGGGRARGAAGDPDAAGRAAGRGDGASRAPRRRPAGGRLADARAGAGHRGRRARSSPGWPRTRCRCSAASACSSPW